RVHREADLRHTLAAHAAGHAHALEDARGGRRGTDRARLADVVRAVRHRAAGEAVPLHRALEALADGDPGHLHLVARLEDLHGDVLALHGVREVAAELDEVAVGAADAVRGQMTALGLRDLALGDGLPGELDALVAVGVRRAHGDDRARARLDHRHRRDGAALLVEERRHAQLLSEDAFHVRA